MTNGLTRVVFDLEPAPDRGSETERLWAERLPHDLYRIRNSPYHAFDVSFGDIVRCETRDGQLHFVSVVIRGGHSTYRIIPTGTLDSPDFKHHWANLARLGCTYEGGPILAIDVPGPSDIHAVYQALTEGEEAGVWHFEEGHCGHLT